MKIKITKFQNEVEKLKEMNQLLENKVFLAKKKEDGLCIQIAQLTQKSIEMENMIKNHARVSQFQAPDRFDSENMELNLEQYSCLMQDVESRKNSTLAEDKKGISIELNPANDLREKKRLSVSFTQKTNSPKLKFPDLDLQEKPKFNFAKLEENQSIMYPQISVILHHKDNFETPFLNVYSEYVYVCSDKFKILKLLVVENRTIMIFKNKQTRKSEKDILISSINKIVVSRDHPQIFEVFFKNEKGVFESILFENYAYEAFFDFIKQNQDFDSSCQKIGEIMFTTGSMFKSAICNIYKAVKKAGFLEQTQPENSWGICFGDFHFQFLLIFC